VSSKVQCHKNHLKSPKAFSNEPSLHAPFIRPNHAIDAKEEASKTVLSIFKWPLQHKRHFDSGQQHALLSPDERKKTLNKSLCLYYKYIDSSTSSANPESIGCNVDMYLLTPTSPLATI
jgi:hypothetical protein